MAGWWIGSLVSDVADGLMDQDATWLGVCIGQGDVALNGVLIHSKIKVPPLNSRCASCYNKHKSCEHHCDSDS